MYEALVKALRSHNRNNLEYWLDEAADVIEELSRENESPAKSVNEASEILRKCWIPVTEAIPEDGVEVLCWYEYYHWSKGKVMPDYGIGYQFNGCWGGEVSNGRDCRMLAWMPLPEPPKEE